jgi:Bacterial SH3 domain
MRVTTLILVLICSALAIPGEAAADKVKSNQETKLFARPGERAKVIAKVGSGKMMTVLAKEGRWLKVRVAGRTGYVARSTVDLPDEGEIARNTRRRSFVDGRGKSRGFGGEAGPDDRIGADAVGEGREDGGEDASDDEEEEAEPKKPAAKVAAKPAAKVAAKPTPKKGSDEEEEDEEDENPLPKGKTPAKAAPTKAAPTKVAAKEDDEEEDEDEDTRKRVKVSKKTPVYNDANLKSEVILTATKDTQLFPTGEKSGKFTEVENDEGDLGYILTADIESTGGGGEKKVADKGSDDDDDDNGGELRDEAPAVGGNQSRQIDVRIRAGVSFLTQGLRSPGGAAGPPNNYDISTAAMTVALGGGYYKSSGKKVYGIETTYDYAKALPGIKVPMGKTTSISLHNLNLRGVFGLDFHRPSGMMLLGRLGFRYSSFQVGKVQSMTENTALLPSEVIMAPMIGVALAMPRLGKKIGLRFSVDVMPLTLSYSQTKNLEDGKSPSAKGAIVGVGFTYRWKSSMDITATYDLTYQSASFGDTVMTSARMHPMGGVTRSDLYHAVTAGIVKSF